MPNLAAFLAAREDEPQRLLIRESAANDSVDWTFGDLTTLAARWQSAFVAAGLNPGDRIAISARNSGQWLAIDQAALGLGLVVVALDPQASARFAAACIAHSGANLLLIDSASRARHILSAGPAIDRVIMLRKLQHGRDRLSSLEEFLPDAPSAPFCVTELEEDALATLCYQRVGKDGIRGAMLSHNNLLAAVHAQQSLRIIKEDELVLAGGSFAQMLARITGLYVPLALGARIAVAAADATLENSLRQCAPQVLLCDDDQLEQTAQRARAGLAASTSSPSLGRQLDVAWRLVQGRASWLDRVAHRLSKPKLTHALHQGTGGQLKRVICGQPSSRPEAVRQLTAQGVDVLPGLSLDIAAGLAALSRPEDINLQSCGQALPGIETRVSDRGELLLRGLALAQGYWNDPATTQADFEPEGWLHTGLTAHLEGEHIMMGGFLPGTAPQQTQQIHVLPDLSMTNSTLPG
jgi:long-chain acyl-CoA synthetase